MWSWIEYFWGPALILDAAFVYIALRRNGIGLSDVSEALFDGLRRAWRRLIGS